LQKTWALLSVDGGIGERRGRGGWANEGGWDGRSHKEEEKLVNDECVRLRNKRKRIIVDHSNKQHG
jgi:hypothetical protein